MIEPVPCRFMTAAACFIPRKTPRSSTAMVASKPSTPISSMGPDSGESGVVEEAVEPAKATDGLVHHRRNVGLAAHVGVDVHRARAGVLGDAPAPLVLEIRQHHRCALIDEEAHGGFADAAGASGDERDLTPEPLHTRGPGCSLLLLDVVAARGGRTSLPANSTV